MGLYSKYERYAAPLSAEQLQAKLDDFTAAGKEIIHYEEKKQEPDRFYVTIILGTLSEADKNVAVLLKD